MDVTCVEMFCQVLMTILSPGVVACAVLWRIIRLFISRKWLCEHRVPDMWAMFGYSALLLLAMWSLRLAESYVVVTEEGFAKAAALTSWEGWAQFSQRLMTTVAQTLKAFGVEENIGEYIDKGRFLSAQLWPQLEWVPFAYGVYAAALNVLAPVTGAALIFEVIASIFPKVQVWFLRWNFLRKKYIFSQLNTQSLALAASIVENKGSWFHPAPVIVFTNTDLQPDDEAQTVLLLKAKRMGAICTPDDITTISSKRFWPANGREYMLMDPVDVNNVIKYAEMTEQPEKEAEKQLYKRLKKCSFWIFCQDNAYMLTETEITENMNRAYEKVLRKKVSKRTFQKQYSLLLDAKKNENKNDATEVTEDEVWASLAAAKVPVVRHTRPYMNIVTSVLEKHPLFEPLADQPGKKTLNVAVLGGGGIGMEMLLNSYWCGQLLDVALGINVVSLEEAPEFREKLDAVSEEILLSAVRGNDMLKIYDDKAETNEPYCSFRYHSADLLVTAPEAVACDPLTLDEKGEVKTGEGSMKLLDADYFLVALGSDETNITVTERLCRALALQGQGAGQKVVVCVVYDSSLHRSMNLNMQPFGGKLKRYAVGGIEDMYSYANIIAKADQNRAKKQDLSYTQRAGLPPKKKNAFVNDPYGYWSSEASAMHNIYKSFCAFRCYTAGKKATWAEWKEKVGENWCYQDDDVRKAMAWLEHRRWNAYIRSSGFTHRENIAEELWPELGILNKDMYKKYRQKMRFHNCLVEWARNPIKDKKDRLDLVGDVKKYDVPELVGEKEAAQIRAYVDSLPAAEKEIVNV